MLINFEDDLEEPTRPYRKFLALILVAVIPVGFTLASNINLGAGSPIEFGQGVQTLVTCAPNVPIYLRPRHAFVNAPGSSAAYSLTGISLDGIQNSCIGYDFIIKAFGQSDAPLPLFDTNKSEIRVYQTGGGAFSKSASDGFTLTNVGFGTFVAEFNTPVSKSADVYRITLETVKHDTSMLRYNIGDAGPGGGIIFLTPNSPGNNTGQYFEATTNYIATQVWCNLWPIDIPQATGTAIGQGAANTIAITSVCSTGAANSAVAYSGGNASDWFLPSTGELEAYFNAGIVTLTSSSYWSSTQYDPDDAYDVSWPGVYVGGYLKIGSLPVIAVRSFY